MFWSAVATDIWFDDEWIFFDWSVVTEACEIWFSAWDWQDTDLVGCLMNSVISTQIFFAERILHLRYLKNGSASISFNALIYFGDFFFIYLWALWVDPLPTFIAAYPIDLFCFWLIVFLIIADSVSGWFLLHMWHTQIQSSELHALHCPVNIKWVNQRSVDKWREINNWYAN